MAATGTAAATTTANSTHILGCLRVTLHRGENVLSVDRNGKADPYVKIKVPAGAGVDPSTFKLKWKSFTRKKTTSPVWDDVKGDNNSAFFWIFNTTTALDVELWDYNRLSKNKLIGTTKLQLAGASFQQVQTKLDVPGEGKFQGQHAGSLFISVSFKTLADATVPFFRFSWPSNTHVLLEMDLYSGRVELQGDIDDIMLLQVLAGLRAGLPYQDVDGDGKHRCWFIPFSANKSYAAQRTAQTSRRDNLGQNLMFMLADRFAACGFRLCRQNVAKMVVVGSGDNQRTVKMQDYWLLMRKVAPGMDPNDPNLPRHLYMDPAYSYVAPHFRIELQGAIPPQVMQALAGDPWKLNQIIDKDSGITLAFLVEVPDMKRFFLTQAAFKRQENQWQSFAMKMMDLLQHYGCYHITAWGDGHIFSFAQGGNLPQARNHMMVDAGYFGGKFQLELQGDITDQEAASCGQAVGVAEVNKLTQKTTGELSAYNVPLKYIKAVNFTAAGVQKNTNRLQNAALKCLDQLTALGYVLLTSHDLNDLVLYRDPVASRSIGPTLLVEPAWQHGFQVEIQGNISEQSMSQVAGMVGHTELRKVTDDRDNSILSFQLPVAGSLTSWSIADARRKQNRIEGVMLRTIDALSQFSFLAFMTYGTGGPLLLRQVPGVMAGTYALADVQMIDYGNVAIEMQGASLEREEQTLAHVCAASGMPAMEKVFDKDGTFLCYQFRVKVRNASMTSLRKTQNEIQNLILKVMNLFSTLGYIHMFPTNSQSHLFYKPTGAPMYPPPVQYVPLHYLPLLANEVWQQGATPAAAFGAAPVGMQQQPQFAPQQQNFAPQQQQFVHEETPPAYGAQAPLPIQQHGAPPPGYPGGGF